MNDNEIVEGRKEKKSGKWTLETAVKWLNRNGHKVGEKQVHLSTKAGIAALGCADYLRNVHKYEIFYPER